MRHPRLDRFDLLFIRADHIVEIARLAGSSWSVPLPEKHQSVAGLCRGDRPLDEFERCRPIDAHAALRSIHRFRDTKTETPKVLTIGNGFIPIDCTIEPGIVVGVGVGDDVSRRESDAIELCAPHARKMSRLGQVKCFERRSVPGRSIAASAETLSMRFMGISPLIGQECRPSGVLSSSWSHIPPVAALWRLRAGVYL